MGQMSELVFVVRIVVRIVRKSASFDRWMMYSKRRCTETGDNISISAIGINLSCGTSERRSGIEGRLFLRG